jgi:hypothetical protein
VVVNHRWLRKFFGYESARGSDDYLPRRPELSSKVTYRQWRRFGGPRAQALEY